MEGGSGEEFNKYKTWCQQQQLLQHTTQLPQTKDQTMKDLLTSIMVTAPVFHAEMSELKAELDRNTTQTKEGRTTSGGRRRRGIQ